MIAFRKKIMIVEDDPSLLKVLKFRLEHEGFAVLLARDGQEALKEAQTSLPDLVLMDIKLPVLDGLTVCRCLKSGPVTSHMLILIVSGTEDLQHMVDRCIEVGADGWLKKPFQSQELLDKIQQLFEQKEHADG